MKHHSLEVFSPQPHGSRAFLLQDQKKAVHATAITSARDLKA
jgi:hypothetical protein